MKNRQEKDKEIFSETTNIQEYFSATEHEVHKKTVE
jgi:hypothetical protein